MKYSKFLVLPILTVLLTACSPPDDRYAIINDGNETLEITYKSDVCIGADNRDYWKPKLRANNSDNDQTTNFSAESYEMKMTSEEITGYVTDDKKSKPMCDKVTYRLRIPQNSAAQIYFGKYQGFRANYLQLKNAKGTVTYEGTPVLIENAFTKEKLSPLSAALNGELHYQ